MLFKEFIKAGRNGDPILLTLVKEHFAITAEVAVTVACPPLLWWERRERGIRIHRWTQERLRVLIPSLAR
jgi:hypothetical protein